jgi:hypothetical protein
MKSEDIRKAMNGTHPDLSWRKKNTAQDLLAAIEALEERSKRCACKGTLDHVHIVEDPPRDA